MTAKTKRWNKQMSVAYWAGLNDAESGHKGKCPNKFEACYRQGYQHGSRIYNQPSLDGAK